ncbi:MAG TPA: HAD-IA family hydrolase [Candidatus Limnocylindria bacterium]|nr:HAD-IA family hydrolase [Candidatus Limnocylindria bacterium]
MLEHRPAALFFDVGDTLTRAHPSWPAVYATVYPEFGINVDPEDFEAAWREAFAEWEIDDRFEASEEASYQRFKELDGRIFANLGYPDLPDEFFRAVEVAFSRRSSWFVFDDVAPALDALRQAGFRLGVISNWGWAAPELLHDLELAAHFEALTISARVGFQKPRAEIFRHALEQLDVGAPEALHVGDSYAADVLGARAAGMRAVLIDRDERVRVHGAPEQHPGVPVVRDLLELLDLLGVPRPAARVN